MLNVCPDCGMYDVDKQVIDVSECEASFAICGHCGARHPFIRRPLFVVTGASGAGKSATCLELMRRETGLVTLESDILWGAIDVSGDDGIDRYWNAWLRLVKNIHQGPRSVVLCGTVVPEVLERQPERRYIADIHCLALVADRDAQVERLVSRPAWRGSSDPAFIEEHVRFNQWLVDHAAAGTPAWALLDTTRRTPAATADAVQDWISGIQERSAVRTRSSLS
jgi:broad-specificity NMP kinase